ncbi:MAG: glxR 1 [Verrucomicrobiales bacterium]|nr:glxR 1 [Verrucomicrobiales bacterium]
MNLPLEDNFEDIIGKAQKGLKITNEDLAYRAGIPVASLAQLRQGTLLEGPLRQVAPLLNLHPESLLAIARKTWQPAGVELEGLLSFNSFHPAMDMTVNHFIVFDPASKSAAIFDTGTDAVLTLNAVAKHGLKVGAIFITHTHSDHITVLPALRAAYPDATVYCGRGENLADSAPIDQGFTHAIGNLQLEARETSGHAQCGMSFVIKGLAKPLVIVGDALFAGSMGGGMVSWETALKHNRQQLFSLPPETVVAPGHGPLTTIAEEKANNPFYPEFKPSSNPAMKEKIAFVGVGRMGGNMARRLREVGYQVTAVYDVSAEAAAEVAAEIGATVCTKLADITAAADIIFTVVTNDEAMRGIFYNPDDNLFMGAAGKTFINCATLTPQVHIDLEAAADAIGAKTIEGCMASSIPQAREGTLQLMIGGRREVFESVQPLLKTMSAVLTYVGSAGQAAKVKALVNMVMNINTAGLAEGLGLGASLGLDLEMLAKVFSVTGANSRVLQTDGEDMIQREHSCFFRADHAAKDSHIALSLAREAGLNLPLAAATAAQYDRMIELNLGELDKSGIAELTFKSRRG